MKSTHWTSLDGLRAIAVLIVLLGHAGSPFPRSGGVGVDIFFVLSGFLITGILSREFARYGQIHLGNFYARRFLRLSPCLLLACFLVCCLALIANEAIPVRSVVTGLTYTANWSRALFGADLGPLNHCWSLACEEQYYLLWPLVVIAIEKSSRSNNAKGAFLALGAVALEIYRASMVGIFSAERIFFGLDTHMDGLVLGSSLSYFALGSPAALSRTRAAALSYIAVPMAMACLLGIMYFLRWDSPWMGRVGFSTAAFASAVIISDLVRSPVSLLKRALSAPALVYIGRISYGLYLLHYPIFRALDHAFPDERFRVMAPFKIGISIIVAAFSFKFFESRFLTMKHRFERREIGRSNQQTTVPS